MGRVYIISVCLPTYYLDSLWKPHKTTSSQQCPFRSGNTPIHGVVWIQYSYFVITKFFLFFKIFFFGHASYIFLGKSLFLYFNHRNQDPPPTQTKSKKINFADHFITAGGDGNRIDTLPPIPPPTSGKREWEKKIISVPTHLGMKQLKKKKGLVRTDNK